MFSSILSIYGQQPTSLSKIIIRAKHDIKKGKQFDYSDLCYIDDETGEIVSINDELTAFELMSSDIILLRNIADKFTTQDIVQYQPIEESMLEDKATKVKREIEQKLKKSLEKNSTDDLSKTDNAELKQKIENNIWLT